MKLRLLMVLLLMNITLANAQIEEPIPPSPTPSALGKFVDNPVSLYTGKPVINIPLCELSEKDFTLPISLVYDAGGVKVGDIASHVGLGWSLNAGGVITRAVHGYPDDIEWDKVPGEPFWSACIRNKRGILRHGIDLNIDMSKTLRGSPFKKCRDNNFLFPVTLPAIDYYILNETEPDVFYFNFCGLEGKFFFKVENGQAVIKSIPYQGLIIEHQTTNGEITSFTVKDTKGIVYTFDEVERTVLRESIAGYMPVINRSNFFDRYAKLSSDDYYHDRTEYNSSWYLKKIELPNGDIIDFKYAEQRVKYYRQPGEQSWGHYYGDSYFEGGYNPNDEMANTYSAKLSIVAEVSEKRLEQISTPSEFVEFEADHLRQDIHSIDGIAEHFPRAITGLSLHLLFDCENNRIKKWKFNFGYFQSNSEEDIRYRPGEVWKYNEGENYKYYKRLFLKSIQEFGATDISKKPQYQFEYKYKDYTGNSAHVLPHRFSLQRDLWGYYNGAASNNTLLPKLYRYQDMFLDERGFSVYKLSGSAFELLGANRLPNAELVDVGTLSKIFYPTGGYTSYEFQPHKFMYAGKQLEGGGIRIKTIAKHSLEDGKSIVSNYEYKQSNNENTSGTLISMPVFAEFDRSQVLLSDVGSATPLPGIKVFSCPSNQLGGTHGSPVGYKRVSESIMDNGKTVYNYTIPSRNEDSPKIYIHKLIYWYMGPDGVAFGYEDKNQSIMDETSHECYSAFSVNAFYNSEATYISDNNYEIFNIVDEGHTHEVYYDVVKEIIEGAGIDNIENPSHSLLYPFPPMVNSDWNRGQLISKKYYNNTGKIIKEELFSYDLYYPFGESSPEEVYGLKLGGINGTEENLYFSSARYKYLTNVAKVLSSKTVTDYSISGNTISKTTTYQYNGQYHKNPTKVVEENSTGDKIITKYTYTGDFHSSQESTPLYDLYQKNIKDIPIEVSEFIEKDSINYLLRTNVTTYDFTEGKPFPDKYYEIETNKLLDDFKHCLNLTFESFPSWPDVGLVYTSFEKDSRYSEKLHYKKYDSRGNILEVEDKTNGIITCYIWGYGRQYPIAKIVNASYSEIESVLGSNLEKLNVHYYSNYCFSDSEIRNMLEPLRTNLPNSQVTICTYKPLVGITSRTDQNGVTIFYEYDELNRLNIVKDNKGNILKKHEYNYKND